MAAAEFSERWKGRGEDMRGVSRNPFGFLLTNRKEFILINNV